MTQNPEFSEGVGEDIAGAIDERARQAAFFQSAVTDLVYLAEHGDVELLRAVRDLNLHPGSPDSYLHANDLQKVRHSLGHALVSLGFSEFIVHEQISEVIAPSRQVRPPIVDVELP